MSVSVCVTEHIDASAVRVILMTKRWIISAGLKPISKFVFFYDYYLNVSVSILELKDTEAAVCDVQVPHIDAEVISGQVGLPIAVDRDGVDMVSVSVGEHSSGADLYHQIRGLQHRHLRSRDWRKMKEGKARDREKKQ